MRQLVYAPIAVRVFLVLLFVAMTPRVAVADEAVDLSALDEPTPMPAAPAKPSKPLPKKSGASGSKSSPRSGETAAAAESASSGATSAASAAVARHNPHGGSGVDPHFSVLFDILLAYQPGKAEFSFLNFHPLLLAEIVPTSDLIFSFEVNPSPRYYELDYQLSPALQLRAGKIWIPFDDLNPHSAFGGRINASRLRLGNTAFLPDIFTDLGVGWKWVLADTAKLTLEWHGYVVNGFSSGGTDPAGTSAAYPSFTDIAVGIADTNRDKALGTRVHLWLSKTFGLGASYYTARWTEETQPSKRLALYAADLQLRFPSTEFRAGISYHAVDIPNGERLWRHGNYVELGQKFGKNREWKILGRAGLVDPDPRFTTEDDLAIGGLSLLYQPGLVQWSLECQQDFKQVPGKRGYTFAGARAVIQL